MYDDIQQELQRARTAYCDALRAHGSEETEESKRDLEVATRFLAAAVGEYLGI